MNAEKLRELYLQANIEAKRKEVLADSDLTAEQQAELERWASEKWSGFLRLIDPVDDDQEKRKTLINQYIEFKSHWFMLNTMLQFSLFQYGEADPVESYRSSLLSELVGFLKGFLSESEAGIIDKFLAEPLAKELGDAGEKINRVGDMSESVESLDAQLNDLYAEREELVKTLGTADPGEIALMISSLEEQLNILYEERESSPAAAPPSAPSPGAGDDDEHALMIASLEEQLGALYEERESLEKELGVSDAEGLMQMVSSMDEQLRTLYEDMEGAVVIDGRQVTIMGARKVIVKKKR